MLWFDETSPFKSYYTRSHKWFFHWRKVPNCACIIHFAPTFYLRITIIFLCINLDLPNCETSTTYIHIWREQGVCEKYRLREINKPEQPSLSPTSEISLDKQSLFMFPKPMQRVCVLNWNFRNTSSVAELLKYEASASNFLQDSTSQKSFQDSLPLYMRKPKPKNYGDASMLVIFSLYNIIMNIEKRNMRESHQ